MKKLLINQDTPQSITTLVLGIWGFLSRRRRIQLAVLLAVMLASGGAELISLGAVLPFLVVLSDPDRIWQQPLLRELAIRVGFTEATQLLLPATFVFALAAILAGLVRLINLRLNGRLAAAVGSDLSCEAYRRTLYQPYEVHLRRNSAAVITASTTQINLTVVALNSLLQLITSSVVAIGLFIGLLLVDAPVAVGAVILFGFAYGYLALTSRRELSRNGEKIAEASSQQVKALQEGLGAIRDVLLNGTQNIYLNIYRQADRPQRQLLAKNVFLSTFPRYSLEALGMVAIALLGGLLVLQRGSGAPVIPLLGALALGAQRLLPALQQIYSGWASLKGRSAAIQSVLAMLNQPLPPVVNDVKPLSFKSQISLHRVYFHYESEQPEVLKGLNLQIRVGERLGIIGGTGSGKSTTVDIIMGLLSPTSGSLLIDGIDLHDPNHPERLVAWRASIAHVPQTIYLADSSIAENIAFGVPLEDIDFDRLKTAASHAQIADFIESSCDGYDSFVGERGIRLSGGQRQRIGIARALYKQAPVLVFDEATSALDTGTERALIHAVEAFNKDLTIVMIAHRLSTLQGCDRVIRLANGGIEAEGNPDQLLNTSS